MNLDHHAPPAAERQDFEFAAALAAHEMSGPITTASLALELLRSRLDGDDEVSADLAATAARHLRLARLQTSRLASLAQGPPPPRRESTDLEALAREMIGDLSLSELADRSVGVSCAGAVVGEVDPDQVRQALYNLLTNAALYSPRDRTIVVDISERADQVLLRVKDQGHGVAPEFAERIFEPYQRDARDGDATPGLGVGLSISRDIARGHGGDLTLEAAPKGGAVFLLALPRQAPSG